MIKLKKLIKEGSPGFIKRKFGDPLPTFKDVMETHQDKPKEPIKESNLPKFIVPGDVSYYDKHWGDTFDELGNHRAIDMDQENLICMIGMVEQIIKQPQKNTTHI